MRDVPTSVRLKSAVAVGGFYGTARVNGDGRRGVGGFRGIRGVPLNTAGNLVSRNVGCLREDLRLAKARRRRGRKEGKERERG